MDGLAISIGPDYAGDVVRMHRGMADPINPVVNSLITRQEALLAENADLQEELTKTKAQLMYWTHQCALRNQAMREAAAKLELPK